MRRIHRPWVIVLAAGALLAVSSCASTPGYGGTYYEPYYEPYGYDNYVGWGTTYYVGPPRGGHDHDHGHDRDDHDHPKPVESYSPARTVQRPAPTYRPASPSRSIPSIPTQSHPHS